MKKTKNLAAMPTKPFGEWRDLNYDASEYNFKYPPQTSKSYHLHADRHEPDLFNFLLVYSADHETWTIEMNGEILAIINSEFHTLEEAKILALEAVGEHLTALSARFSELLNQPKL